MIVLIQAVRNLTRLSLRPQRLQINNCINKALRKFTRLNPTDLQINSVLARNLKAIDPYHQTPSLLQINNLLV